jgi:hypothetical protein
MVSHFSGQQLPLCPRRALRYWFALLFGFCNSSTRFVTINDCLTVFFPILEPGSFYFCNKGN